MRAKLGKIDTCRIQWTMSRAKLKMVAKRCSQINCAIPDQAIRASSGWFRLAFELTQALGGETIGSKRYVSFRGNGCMPQLEIY